MVITTGWVKLYRKMFEWEWFTDHNTLVTFIALLLLANRENTTWRKKELKPGQLITSRDSLSRLTNLSPQKIRTSLEKLKSTNEITIKTTSQFTVITIKNWKSYQGDQPRKQPTNNQQITNDQPTNNQQITTVEEVKKERIKNLNNTLPTLSDEKINPSGLTKEDVRNGYSQLSLMETKPSKEATPYEEIKNLFNNHCPTLSKVKTLSDKRKKDIKKIHKELKNLTEWEVLFKKLENSEFHTGRQAGCKWKADFDWLIGKDKNGAENWIKIYERQMTTVWTQFNCNIDRKGGEF